jgi:hypothetical protein
MISTCTGSARLKGRGWNGSHTLVIMVVAHADSVKDRFTISRDKLQEHIVSANEQPES